MKKSFCVLPLIFVAVVTLVTLARGTAPPASELPADRPKVAAAALENLVQHFDEVDQQKYPWGWIRWLMNAELDPQARMTFGVVQINAGQSNPAHVHPNCEEVLYVLEGSCEHMIGGQTVTLKAGDVIRIPKGVPHAARTSQQESMKAVIAYDTGRRQFVVVDEDGS
jgi:quercetin dioxygenase-like cupin family protein